MAILEIVEYPDKRLRLKSEEIGEITDEIRRLAADMAQTMYAAPGIGLAAIQVGRPVRMLTCDLSGEDEESRLLTILNPVISEEEGEVFGEEGCLSLPGAFEEVRRAERFTLDYMDLEGARHTLKADGMLAICLQHEIDHLDGKLFIDRISGLKRKLAVRKIERFKQERARKQERGADAASEG